jgi:hypothetical protein
MNRMNAIVALGLTAAGACLERLEQLGCTVRDVRITSRNPRIEIDPPPAGVLDGGVMRRERIKQRIAEIYATHLDGCEVRWGGVA